jgi:hypothetical protein
MIRPLLRTLLPAVALLAAVGPAAAQYPYPYPTQGYGQGYRPSSPLSPYLNLLGGPSNNAAVNYYNFVRPNLQLQQAQQMYGGGIAPLDTYSLASDITLDPTKALPRSTGLPTAFMNYGGYFNSMGTIGVPTARGAQPAVGGRPPVPSVPRR